MPQMTEHKFQQIPETIEWLLRTAPNFKLGELATELHDYATELREERTARVCTECGAVVVGPEGHKCDACGCGLLTSLTLAYCTLRQKRQGLQQENEELREEKASLQTRIANQAAELLHLRRRKDSG